MVGISGDKNKDQVTVNYTEQTEFAICTSTDGSDGSMIAGSKQDLTAGSQVVLGGEWG